MLTYSRILTRIKVAIKIQIKGKIDNKFCYQKVANNVNNAKNAINFFCEKIDNKFCCQKVNIKKLLLKIFYKIIAIKKLV